jgi:GntR family transcriptional regulator
VININVRDPKPIYEQVRDNFRDLIISGALPVDYRMPSVRELASKLAINPNTIQRAYRELETEGYIVSVPGRGSFVCSSEAAVTERRRELEKDFVSLAGELKNLGAGEDELISLIKGGSSDD